MELMFDLQVLALQADLTRVITFKTGYDLSNKTFPESGTNKSIHGSSHHGNRPPSLMEFNKINTYRLGQMAYFLEKMKNTVEGGASLLDRTAIVWGSPMGDPNLHNHRRCPLLLMGRANGALEGNLHLRAPQGTPMANVFVSLMRAIGHDDPRPVRRQHGCIPAGLPQGARGLGGGSMNWRRELGLAGAALALVLLGGAVLPGDTPLLDATRRGDVAAVRSLLKERRRSGRG